MCYGYGCPYEYPQTGACMYPYKGCYLDEVLEEEELAEEYREYINFVEEEEEILDEGDLYEKKIKELEEDELWMFS